MTDFTKHDPLSDGISSLRLLDYMGSSIDIVNDARQSFDAQAQVHLSGPKASQLLGQAQAHLSFSRRCLQVASEGSAICRKTMVEACDWWHVRQRSAWLEREKLSLLRC